MAKRGLGRGLASLIPVEEGAGGGVLEIDPQEIVPNPHQPRQRFAPEALEALAASIREHGLIQPLIVTRRAEGGYQLIAGERRWRAARLVGLKKVPVLLKEATPQEMLELALVENLQRADLNPLEEALAYRHLAETFGLSQAEIARRVGKSRAAVANTLRLLQAAPEVQAALAEGRISEGHARALLGLESGEAQVEALHEVLALALSVRQTEALVRRRRERAAAQGEGEPVSPEMEALENRFQEALGTRVALRAGRKGGRIIIYYYSDEEFRHLYRRLTGETL